MLVVEKTKSALFSTVHFIITEKYANGIYMQLTEPEMVLFFVYSIS